MLSIFDQTLSQSCLKFICVRKLINSLGNGNASELLLLANLYSAKHLKVQAIDFIKMDTKEVLI